jgi:hypothetical protein
MPYNLTNNRNSRRVGLGPGLLYLNAWGAGTPSLSTANDIGMVRNASFSLTRQKVELILGIPKQKIVQYVVQEDATLNATGLEWNLRVIKNSLGAGEGTFADGSDETMKFGGDAAISEHGLQFIHQLPAGGTVTLDMYRVQGGADFNVNFGDDFDEIPHAYSALNASTAWTPADTLGSKEQLFRIRVQI